MFLGTNMYGRIYMEFFYTMSLFIGQINVYMGLKPSALLYVTFRAQSLGKVIVSAIKMAK